MSRRIQILKSHIHIVLALLILLGTAFYSLIFVFSGREPRQPPGTNIRSDGVSGTVGAGTEIMEPYGDQSETQDAERDALTTLISLDYSDISRGSLVLVNYAHSFDVPAEYNFVSIAGAMTQSYRVVNDQLALCGTAIGPLNDMMDAFYAETGLRDVTIRSAFRGYESQQAALDNWIATVGQDEALRFAALPGHSEHHTGLAVDFGIYDDGNIRQFTGTGAHAWFRYNAHRFGFILRYTEEFSPITGVADEPWHFRYVGLPHSYFIFGRGWALEEYIAYIMNLGPGQTLRGYYNGAAYEVFFSRDTEIAIPIDAEYTISGSNIDGFIVTIRVAE